jgi:hypothetical protein
LVDESGVGWEGEHAGVRRAAPAPGLQQPQPQRGGFQGLGDDIALVRAMYNGPWSLR